MDIKRCNVCKEPLEHARHNQVICSPCWAYGLQQIYLHNISRNALSRLWNVNVSVVSIRYAVYSKNEISMRAYKNKIKRYDDKVRAERNK